MTRLPQELVFDTASTLYVAQAGPHIQEKYDVSNIYILFKRNFKYFFLVLEKNLLQKSKIRALSNKKKK
ncbi:GSCOCG00011933001-RA-CDS, partial [Cotesia congregata]